ncbi:MAG: hypothetical protein H6611_05440 [Ignavibacteriales bacterium]|nr:hypothetical protein [Ignavibacteriales bacterium]
MDYFQLEIKQQELVKLVSKEKSSRVVVVKIIDFVNYIIESIDFKFAEAFICDLIPILNKHLNNYKVYGTDPNITKIVVKVVEKLKGFNELNEYFDVTNDPLQSIKEELSILEKSLNGDEQTFYNKNSFYFPVIEKSNTIDFKIGLIDSLKVTLISKKKIVNDEFIINPAIIELENRASDQIKNSWSVAKKYVKDNYSVSESNFQVLIQFEYTFAQYEGNSFGIPLTIGFISSLLSFYNLRDEIYFKSNIISSGAVNADSTINKLGKEIIKTKVNTIFFSPFTQFIIPKEDENYAIEYLENLKKQYPHRNLEIIGIKNLDDIISRRNLIDIERKKILLWSAKKIIKNKVFILIAIILIVHSFTYYILKLDNNPNSIEYVSNKIEIINKFNEILWMKNNSLSKKHLNTVQNVTYNISRLIDVDDDGFNEVLLAKTADNPALILYDRNGKEIWNYIHTDSIETVTEKFTGIFGVHGIIDTIHNGARKELLIYFQHYLYYPTGIIKLDLLTGKKVSNVLWHPGSIGGAILFDWNADGKKEIIAGGASNGMNRAFLFSIDHDKLKGTFPTSENYLFKNIELADFNNYILFPKTDYAEHFFAKYNAVLGKPIIVNNMLSIGVFEGKANLFEADFGYSVRLNKNLFPSLILVGDAKVNFRDNLVKKGILNPPLTDTPEFINTIKENILIWNGSKFVELFMEN